MPRSRHLGPCAGVGSAWVARRSSNYLSGISYLSSHCFRGLTEVSACQCCQMLYISCRSGLPSANGILAVLPGSFSKCRAWLSVALSVTCVCVSGVPIRSPIDAPTISQIKYGGIPRSSASPRASGVHPATVLRSCHRQGNAGPVIHLFWDRTTHYATTDHAGGSSV